MEDMIRAMGDNRPAMWLIALMLAVGSLVALLTGHGIIAGIDGVLAVLLVLATLLCRRALRSGSIS